MSLFIRITVALLIALSAGILGSGNSLAMAAPELVSPVEIRAALDGEPVIMNILAGALPGNRVSLSGFAVDDESLAGCIAYIKGKGVNKTAIILADGTFSTSFRRPTNREFVVEVTVVDADGNASETIQVLFPGL